MTFDTGHSSSLSPPVIKSHHSKGSNMVNSLWNSDAIWQHTSGLTLAQVMACCLISDGTNPSWPIRREVLKHSPECNFTENTPKLSFLDMSFKMTNSTLQPHPPEANELILPANKIKGTPAAADALAPRVAWPTANTSKVAWLLSSWQWNFNCSCRIINSITEILHSNFAPQPGMSLRNFNCSCRIINSITEILHFPPQPGMSLRVWKNQEDFFSDEKSVKHMDELMQERHQLHC